MLVRREQRILTSCKGVGLFITRNWPSAWLVVTPGKSLKLPLLTNSSLAVLEISITVELNPATFSKVFLYDCLIRVPASGAFIGWILTAPLSFLHLKVLSPV